MLSFFKRLGFPLFAKPLGGRYRIIKKLESGGFGQTFLAQDLHLPDHPTCVIKQLKPQNDATSLKMARRLFDTEAQTLYKLGNHPQIPRLLAHFEDQQEFYLAQEYIEGEPLSESLLTHHPWSQERVISLLEDILGVLSLVHQQDVIHRDLKPQNLLVRYNDQHIVLIDFGAVKQVDAHFLNQQTEKANVTIAIGTQGYMPNEQLAGHPRFSSDVYAVGIIAIQALTGVPPQQLQQNFHTGELEWRDPNLAVDDAFATVLDQMVHFDFRDRYPSATEALTALQQLPSPLQEGNHWYIPTNNSPIPPSANNQSTIAQAEETADQTRSASPSHQQETVEAVPSPQSPGMTGIVSYLPQISKQTGFAIGGLLGFGGLLLVLKTCSFSPSTSPVANSPSSPETKTPTQPASNDNSTPNSHAPFSEPNQGSNSTSEKPAIPTPKELVNQGHQLRNNDQYQQALPVYNQAIERNPKLAEAHWGRCYSLNKLQQFQEAIEACDRAIALAPNDPRPLSSQGYALQQQQRFQDALNAFNQALEADPNYVEAINNRGTLFLELDRPQAALEAFNRALDLQPDLAQAWNNRGAALWHLKRFEDAIASVERALELKPDYAAAQQLQQQMRSQLPD